MKPLNPHIDGLIRKHCRGTLSEAEARELENWKEFSDANRQVFKERVLLHSSGEETFEHVIARPRLPLRKAILFSVMAAAAIPFLILIVSLYAGGSVTRQENTAGLTRTDTFSRLQLPASITFEKDSVITIDRATVEDVMKLVTYLYHVPVAYASKVTTNNTLSGVVNHRATIATMLKMLEFNGIKASYDGKTLYVGSEK